MQPLADLIPVLASMAPVAEEFYLLCFFCLGFALFRTETMKRLLCVAPRVEEKLKGFDIPDPIPSRTCAQCMPPVAAPASAARPAATCTSTSRAALHQEAKTAAIAAPSTAVPQPSSPAASHDSLDKVSDSSDARTVEADTAALNSALNVAVSSGDRDSAARIFEEMKASNHVDVVSFNILLKQHIGAKGDVAASKALLEEMQHMGLRPSTATYNSLLGAALSIGDFGQAWRIVDEMEGGPGIDAYTLSILFKGYKGRRRVMDVTSFDRALALLERYNVRVDEVLVNVALEACMGLKDPARLHTTFGAFQRSGWAPQKPCAMHTYATLIKAYGVTRQLNMAWKLWGEATAKKGTVPTEQLYSQMIDVLVSNGRLEDALNLFQDMKAAHGAQSFGSQGFAVAYAMVIRGFAQRKECKRALDCYEEMKVNGVKVGLVVFNTLVDACSRVGDMDAAARLFRDMLGAECMPDLITYSTLIKGYCVRGELEQALDLFALMRRKGIQPDAIVFNSLLDGCAKKQMPEMCEQVIRDMEEAGILPSNHSASILIKLYGRCRDLDAAFRVLDEMPRKYGFRPNAAVYTCLMSTCIANGRLDLAMDLRSVMMKVGEPLDEKTYSTLLRGALRSGSVADCTCLLRAALADPAGARRLLDEELAQSALALLHKRRAWDEHGCDLLGRLQQAGVQVRAPDKRWEQQNWAAPGQLDGGDRFGPAKEQAAPKESAVAGGSRVTRPGRLDAPAPPMRVPRCALVR